MINARISSSNSIGKKEKHPHLPSLVFLLKIGIQYSFRPVKVGTAGFEPTTSQVCVAVAAAIMAPGV
jgi:hypothetical protein